MSDEAPTQAEVELAKAERDKKEKIRDIKQKHSGNVLRDIRQHRKSV